MEIRKKAIYWVIALAGFVIFLLCCHAVIFGQEVKPPSVARTSTQRAVPPVGSIELTDAEKTEVDLEQERQQNLELRVQMVTEQIQSARQQLAQQSLALTDKLVKAHSIDLKKYRLDPSVHAFVPVKPAEVKK